MSGEGRLTTHLPCSLYGLPCVLCVFVVIFFEAIMLSADGCQKRRGRLWQRLDPKPESDYLLLADPIHLMYLVNFWIDPFSLGTDFGAFLLLRKDGHTTLIYDKRSPKSVEQAHADDRRVTNWYDGQ